jgi:chitin disaccharide deacetylase
MLAISNNLSGKADAMPVVGQAPTSLSVRSNGELFPTGGLIVNADDWGRDAKTTDRILECVLCGAVSSASAMVFMEDSERAAALARARGIDVGLHLNFTSFFSASDCPPRLAEHQRRLSRYLRANRLAQVVFHPGLAGAFKHVVAAQLEEFRRLYGAEPDRIDGHHHMHLCANVLLGELMPEGTLVRRNFSFVPGEKSWMNRFYRKSVDRRLKRRHRLVDHLFSLAPIEPADRLQRIISLAQHSVVELETHPVNYEEYRFLTSCDMFRRSNVYRLLQDSQPQYTPSDLRVRRRSKEDR